MSPPREARRIVWVRRLARVGLSAKGVIYLLVGLFAAQTALTRGGDVIGGVGALQVIFAQPLGAALLMVMIVGLAAYVLWRGCQALGWDRPGDAESLGPGRRLGYGLNGLAYAGLTLGGIEVLTGSPVQGQEAQMEGWVNRLNGHPLGLALLVLAGLFLVGVGCAIFVEGVTASFCRHMDLTEVSPALRTAVRVIGRLGRFGRTLIYAMLGVLLIQATVQDNPERAVGLTGALLIAARQPLGLWLQAALAVGLLAYGISLLLEAVLFDPAWS